MKRKRVEEMEKEKKGSEISCAIEKLSMVVLKLKADDHSSTAHIATKPFLCVCRNLLLHVLDKIGSSMTVLRQDIHQNIQILEKLHDSDPSVYSNMVEILKKEATEGVAKKGSSCSKAFVWLTRSLDFSLALLQQLVEDFEKNMERAVEESYSITLKPWHGWISSAAYKVALKLVPDTRSLITILMAKDKNCDILKKEMQTLISLLEPALQEIHNLLSSRRFSPALSRRLSASQSSLTASAFSALSRRLHSPAPVAVSLLASAFPSVCQSTFPSVCQSKKTQSHSPVAGSHSPVAGTHSPVAGSHSPVAGGN